ncbi:sulfatase-like hydrolase/transferase [Bacillus sp. V3B]|uniref:sulfatase-like hydrolase/transferase n=1 Tax=Bacillus sp. V3B TaxID=2804915 RepID=UPI00210F0D77|nr:alkaline phosphatase family protein [Bacillus sp. V3B]MCQ6276857.1 sulfatase-like hydrolase/transferase [Bacillus sp. V3B]
MESTEEPSDIEKVKRKNKPKLPKVTIILVAFNLIMFIVPLLTVLGITVLNKGGMMEGVKWFLTHPLEVFFNYLIAFGIINIFLFFLKSKSYLIVALLVMGLLSILAHISYTKTDLRGEPLSILDFRLFSEAANIVDVLSFRFYIPIIVSVILVFLAISFVILFVKLEIPKRSRVFASVVSLFIIILGYASTIDSLSKLRITIPADVSWNHDTNGFLLATLIDSKFLNIPKPDNYSKEAIEEIYKNIQEATDEKSTISKINPNIIFIMSEAFWDLSIASELHLSKEVIPNFKEISNESTFGVVEVPSIGGGTANTEYEVLTGLSKTFLRNYNVPYNPYNSYIHRPVHSLATTFSELDYHTTAIHTYHSWFYRRNEVYKHLGFDKFTSLETLGNKPKIDGMFTDDEVINDLIINEMKKTENPDFIYTITMQGHGPYDDMNSTDNGIRVKNTISDNSKKIIENYANNIYEVDEAFGRLIDTLRNFEEPTLVVYFGDHIPPLGNDVYKEIHFDTEGNFGKKTPVLVWSNYEELNDEINFHVNMLGSYVLDKVGVTSNPYMNYLNAYSKVSPSITPEENEDFYRDFELLQYDIMHGEQYFYELVGQPQVSDQYSIGEPMKIEQTFVEGKNTQYMFIIAGNSIGHTSVAYLNGVEMNTHVKDGSKVVFSIPKDDINEEKPVKLIVKLMDSRGKVIKESNTLEYENIAHVFENQQLNMTLLWETIVLDGEKKWEVFSSHNGYKIVRLNLGLEEVPYYVEFQNKVLTDKNTDTMNEANLSDIYPNGYLYISVSDENSGWGKNITQKEITKYFNEHKYILNILK